VINIKYYISKPLRWLTCKDDLKTGPWRTLLLISFPFFLYLIIPGVLFWLLVRGILWAKEGYSEK
jgi:hypothetical protein